MNRKIFAYSMLLLILLFNTKIMNAQENTPHSLNAQQRSLASLSALTAVGNTEKLNSELHNALDAGLTINEIKEALVQLYAYCGFPRSLNAIAVFREVLETRKANGKMDVTGKDDQPVTDTSGRYETGRKVLENLTKMPQAKPASGFGEFAPRIDAFLKEHLFADVFASEVLNFQQREIVTIAALAAMNGTSAQLQSHISMGMNTGISKSQMEGIFEEIEQQISRQQADSARAVWTKILQSK
ncbi:carboxymuconolactone decarboxylase family protein [Pedobacter sp. AW1-32]|uniref:carboxymuconolactone decarboxylase family protein n=1 Tax=Pedobacter sp. AW1-32 TaxID=3383026 RepID=UPI003FEEDB8D